MNIRPMEAKDLLEVQQGNLLSLPENYQHKYYVYHLLSWPQCSWVAEVNGKIVGYILAKIDDEEGSGQNCHGHLTSLAVYRTYRRLGIAEKLMIQAEKVMSDLYKANYITLHVRRSNYGAYRLYSSLGFEVYDTEFKYYADGEDAFAMKKLFK